ncbi:AMP-binding protein [Brevibacillus sp. SYSU BS000544]|uniref:AMP-binding protein n=1 Tax=Brevibacillus sp. SYSU BS000544 TaxID=3416443 RepID=UPI003CE4DB54
MSKLWYNVWPSGLPKTLVYGEKTLPEVVEEWAQKQPERCAIQFYGKSTSYGKLNQQITSFASGLVELGVKAGDRVGIFLPNCPAFVVAYYAILKMGAIVVPINPMNKSMELAYQLQDSTPKVLVLLDVMYPLYGAIKDHVISIPHVISVSLQDELPTESTLPIHPTMTTPKQTPADTLDYTVFVTQPHQPLPDSKATLDQIAVLQYTSGTTGNPKGAMLTQFNMLANAVGGAQWFLSDEGDNIHLCNLPLFHITGMVNSMNVPLYSGGTIVMMTRFDMEVMIQAIEWYQCEYWVGTATMNIAVVNYPGIENRKLTSLKSVFSGGAPIPLEILQKFKELTCCELLEGYGLSETTAQATTNPRGGGKIGSVGIPLFDTDVRILSIEDPTKELVPGEIGEVAIKGPMVMAGYWNRSEDTKHSFMDGYLLTGDLGYFDQDGYLFISGRKKELIKASGFSVFPTEVEGYLYTHPAVKEACVVGVPDPYRGEEIKAYIVRKEGSEVTKQEIVAWAKEHMADYKYPRIIEFRDELPKTGSGKILRRVLAEEAKA